MLKVRIRILRGKDLKTSNVVETKFFETGLKKALTAKKAGQILASNFPRFDNLITRNGLQKTGDGLLAMRTFEPSEKCDYNYTWEYALISDEPE